MLEGKVYRSGRGAVRGVESLSTPPSCWPTRYGRMNPASRAENTDIVRDGLFVLRKRSPMPSSKQDAKTLPTKKLKKAGKTRKARGARKQAPRAHNSTKIVSASEAPLTQVRAAVGAIKAKSALVKAIAAQIAIPNDYPPVKITTGYSCQRIASAAPKQTTTDDWSSALHAEPTGVYLVANSPYCTGVSAYYPVANEYSLYTAYFNTPTVADTPNDVASQSCYFSSYLATLNLPLIYWDFTDGTALHGSRQFCFTKYGQTGTLFSTNSEIVFHITQGGAPANLTGSTAIIAVVYRGGEWETVSTVATGFGLGEYRWNAPYSGIFGFRVASPPATTYNFQLTATYEQPVNAGVGATWWAQSALPNLSTIAEGVTSMMVTGSSLCVTPAASVLDQAGSVTIGYFSSGMDIFTLVNTDPKDLATTVTSTQTGVNLPFQGGGYTFWRPLRVDDFTLKPLDWANFSSRSLVGTVLDPDLMSGFSVAIVIGPKASMTHRVTRSYSTCFTSISSWFDQEPPIRDDESLRLACDILSAMPAGFENPFHWSDITSFLKKAAGTLLRLAPTVLDAVGGASPELAPFTVPLSAIARSAPVQQAARGLRSVRRNAVVPDEEVEVVPHAPPNPVVLRRVPRA